MTPQERDLITALFTRLQQQGSQAKDADAEALIRQGMGQHPDAAYLLVQTVLIQDMALHDAQNKMAELERKLTAAPASPAQASSFLPRNASGSVPAAGPWGAAPAPAPAAPTSSTGPVWSQAPNMTPQPATQPYGYGPHLLSGGGSGFLRQAAATAAGVVGGSLLFNGIRSMFSPYYGSGFMSGMAMQPGLSETVVNNYYGDQNNPNAAYDPGQQDPGAMQNADFSNDPGQDFGNQDLSQADFDNSQDFGSDPGQDFGGGDDGSFGV
jgi:uncharacterized protein